jgi:hypothetical protein
MLRCRPPDARDGTRAAEPEGETVMNRFHSWLRHAPLQLATALGLVAAAAAAHAADLTVYTARETDQLKSINDPCRKRRGIQNNAS